jgi:hypothetical protein
MDNAQWQVRFKAWQEFAQRIGDRAKVAQQSKHDRAWKLAASVGIPRDACCLHNASIDTDMTGWCFQNPQRLKVAKRAAHMLNDWAISRKAESIISRAYPRA